MVGEGKWYLVSSYEDATILNGHYDTNKVTKFLCFSSDNDFGRSMHNYDYLLTYGGEFLLQ